MQPGRSRRRLGDEHVLVTYQSDMDGIRANPGLDLASNGGRLADGVPSGNTGHLSLFGLSGRATCREAVYVRRMHSSTRTGRPSPTYDSAISFYVQALGFELVEDSPALTNDGRAKRWVVVRPPGAATGLLLAQADGDREPQQLDHSSPDASDSILCVDDFDASYRRLLAYGVEFLTEPRTEPYGRVAVFVDVAGNKWDLLGPC